MCQWPQHFPKYICVRYLEDDLQVSEKFIRMYEVSSTTGEALYQIIIDVLSRYNLPIANLRAQCHDGASNMSGCFKGVQA